MSLWDKFSRSWVRGAAALAALLMLGALLWWVLAEFSGSQPKKKRAVQEIALLKPPPPPPPPKTPPPPKEVPQKIDVPQPDAPDKPADTPPPGPDLGVDAQGGPGGDGFGLVGKKGAGDLIGGTAGNRFAWFGALVKDRIQDALSKDKKLRGLDYRVVVHVWINASGAVSRAELLESTGNADTDNALRAALHNVPPMREGAPGDMPQPIKLRIMAR